MASMMIIGITSNIKFPPKQFSCNDCTTANIEASNQMMVSQRQDYCAPLMYRWWWYDAGHNGDHWQEIIVFIIYKRWCIFIFLNYSDASKYFSPDCRELNSSNFPDDYGSFPANLFRGQVLPIIISCDQIKADKLRQQALYLWVTTFHGLQALPCAH